MKTRDFVAVLITLVMTGVWVSAANAYDHEVKEKGMTFAWKIEGETLQCKMSAKTDGWVAVGFNPSSKMKDANIIIGYVKDGEVTIADHFGDKSTGHSEDEKLGGKNDVTLLGGSEDGGMTTIEFSIPMNSGDKYDAALVADGDTVLLLAYGPDRDSLKPRHKYRGSKTVNLATGAEK